MDGSMLPGDSLCFLLGFWSSELADWGLDS